MIVKINRFFVERLEKFLVKIKHRYPRRYGTMLALFGVFVLTPDTLVMRLSNLETWPLMGWRGIFLGISLLFLWRLFLFENVSKEWRSLFTWPGIIVILAFAINSITFTLGVQETSVLVVLTAFATMPIFAAILSSILLNESQDLAGWITFFAALIGIAIVVSDGANAIGQPAGSTFLGAVYGAITALGLALTFTLARKFPALGVVPAAAVGSIISGIFGFSFSSAENILDTPIWTILTMGFLILPVSFGCLSIAPRYTSAAVVSLIMLLEMVIGPFWVWIGIGEQPSSIMVLGSFFVLIVIAIHIIRTQI